MSGNGNQQQVLYFRVELNKKEGDNPYRIIALPGALSMHNFADVIVRSFDFDFSDPYEFYLNIEKWELAGPLFEWDGKKTVKAEKKNAKAIKAETVFRTKGLSLLLIYGNREKRCFVVTMIKIERYPCIVEKVGNP